MPNQMTSNLRPANSNGTASSIARVVGPPLLWPLRGGSRPAVLTSTPRRRVRPRWEAPPSTLLVLRVPLLRLRPTTRRSSQSASRASPVSSPRRSIRVLRGGTRGRRRQRSSSPSGSWRALRRIPSAAGSGPWKRAQVEDCKLATRSISFSSGPNDLPSPVGEDSEQEANGKFRDRDNRIRQSWPCANGRKVFFSRLRTSSQSPTAPAPRFESGGSPEGPGLNGGGAFESRSALRPLCFCRALSRACG